MGTAGLQPRSCARAKRVARNVVGIASNAAQQNTSKREDHDPNEARGSSTKTVTSFEARAHGQLPLPIHILC